MRPCSSQVTLNILSDLATPHNNSLLKALASMPGIKMSLYYAMKSLADLPWKNDIHDAVMKAQIFGENRINFGLLWYAVTHRHEKFLLVGWSNPTVRAILIAFWILRRPFMFWSDHPDESRHRSFWKVRIRRFFFYIVKNRASHVFAVGRHTVKYFERRGFAEQKLINLPIFIDLGKPEGRSSSSRKEIRAKYHIIENEVLYVAASRFVYAKGFDLLIHAIALIEEKSRQTLKLLLIGHGPEESVLRKLITEFHLQDKVYIESWMEPEQFETTISAADVFVHPARFDAFGGGTLHAMGAGVPVIGSSGAGTVVERVVHGVNGLIFQNEDVQALAAHLTFFLEHPDAIPGMGARARKTAEEWPPERGARILFEAVCG